MKSAFLIVACIIFGNFLFGQTVENIRAEADGDNIKITYRIGGSADAQLYNVILTCSMDGGARFEPRSVQGDVGNNIRGGRSFYTVIWDVFEDVDEVGSAEFFVKVDLVSDMAVPVSTPQDQPVREPERQATPTYPDFDDIQSQRNEIEWRAYLAYTASTLSKVGISFGSLKNFGAYGSFRFGSYIDEWEADIWLTFVAGLTKYIYQNGRYRLHAYAGAGVLAEIYEEYIYYSSWTDSYLVIDGGIINVFGRFNLNLGIEYVRENGIYPVLGLGFVF